MEFAILNPVVVTLLTGEGQNGTSPPHELNTYAREIEVLVVRGVAVVILADVDALLVLLCRRVERAAVEDVLNTNGICDATARHDCPGDIPSAS